MMATDDEEETEQAYEAYEVTDIANLYLTLKIKPNNDKLVQGHVLQALHAKMLQCDFAFQSIPMSYFCEYKFVINKTLNVQN